MTLIYRKEINGLRALAVIPVILFHLDFEIFQKGYLGVDIFFVISGYLITTLIIKDLINKNFKINFFFERRARRILPALYFVMLVTIPFAWIFLSRNELSSYLKSLTAATFFISNYFFWYETPYFAIEANYKPLLHTWSLSIEEQFYLFFPILLIFIYKFNKKLIIYVLEIILIFSLLLWFYGSAKAPNANFYFTFTRIWELIIGAIVAYLIIFNRFSISKLLNNIISFFGLIIIIIPFFFDYFYLKKMPEAFLLTIGTALIIISANKNTLVGKFLSIKIFVGIGILSYSLYLWHFPILAFAKNYYNQINFSTKFLIILLSFILSIVSFKFIEKPFRDNNFISLKKFINLTICLTFFFVFFSLLTFNYFKKKGSDDSRLAKFLSQNNAVFLKSIDERNFIKYRIIYENFNPQILVIGSSRIRELAQKELQKSTLNLSVGGASIEDQIAITEMALEKFNPKTIYLAADPWLFNDYTFKKEWKSLESEYDKALLNINFWNNKNFFFYNKLKLINADDEIIHLTYSENILEKIYSRININSKLVLPKNIQDMQQKQIILKDGKRVYDFKHENRKIQKEILRHSSMDNYKFSTAKFINYDNFLNYLKHYHNKEVILVLSPYYNPSFEITIKEIPIYLEIEKKFINLAAKNNIKILGSYDSKLVNCKDNEFYDSFHPKDICMQKVIRKIN